MKNFKIIALAILLTAGIGVYSDKLHSQAATPTVISTPTMQQTQYLEVNPLNIVANPTKYLNRNVKIRAKFDKFSTLGLDYPPAMRSSEKYISFLIQRPDVIDHNIPLSELKIFLKKEVAEKNIDLDAGDEIMFAGKVFSTALGDAWMDVEDFKVINKHKKDSKTTIQE